MPQRVANLLKFRLERLVLRGAHFRLLLIAALIGLLSVTAGALVHRLDPTFDGGFPAAVWWAFLRLTDPGYLGDDIGAVQRTVSTVLTVLGYVLFLGALIAIMTQWLNKTMAELEAGLTPIAQRDHVLIIGWTSRTATMVRELVLSEGRVRRFLRVHGARRLRIAILADAVTAAMRLELRERLGTLWNERQLILRSGSPLRLEHLRRVDFSHASVVILPAGDFEAGGAAQADTRTVKTLLSLANHSVMHDGADLPLAVAEIFDSRKIGVAVGAYRGPVEILASDAIISRLLAQSVRHRGLSYVYGELLTHGRGNEIYIRECNELRVADFGEAVRRFPQAIPLGIVRPAGASWATLLNPAPDTVVQEGDRLVLLAHNYAATEPQQPAAPAAAAAPAERLPVGTRGRRLRVLVLGWSHKVPALLREFDSYTEESFHIDVISTAGLAEREVALRQFDFVPSRVTATQIEADFTTPQVLQHARPDSYDNIVLLGSDRAATDEESDARSILAYLLLRDVLPETGGPAILIELLDPGNVTLFRKRRGEVIISPMILSHMLAQVALRRELRAVFDELFGPSGAEIMFRPIMQLGLAARETSFREIMEAASVHGEIALGVRTSPASGHAGRALTLNPKQDRVFSLTTEDEVIVLR